MVKVGGNENHRKHVQNTEICPKSEGQFGTAGGMKNLPEIGEMD